MAVQFNVKGEGATRSSEYRFFPEQLIVKAELNGRHELPDISWLIADIVERTNQGLTGQLEPVTIRKGEKDQPVLVAGFSRWRAISHINKHKLLGHILPIRCVYTNLTEAQAFLANISENRFRNPTTEIDDAHNIVRLRNAYMMSDAQIARVYFPQVSDATELKKAVSWIKKRAKLANLTPEAEAAVKSGRIKESAAASIAKLSEQQQQELLAKSGDKIQRKDVIASKPPKPPKRDVELERRVSAVLEDIEGVLSDNDAQYIEVDRILLLNLSNYMKEIRPLA